MRLIDADLLKENIVKWLKPSKPDETEMIDVADALAITIMEIDEQPTAFDTDIVVGTLEEVKNTYVKLALFINDDAEKMKYIAKEQAMLVAIGIVKGGGIE